MRGADEKSREAEEGALPGVGVLERSWVKLWRFCRRHDAQT